MNLVFQSSERTPRLIKALEEAVMRLDQTRIIPDSSDSFAPLGEALDWTTRLDIDFAELHGDSYRNARDKHELGGVVLGQRFAKNLFHHNSKAMDLVDVVGGIYFPMRFPLCPFELKWKSLANLPKPERRDKLLVDAYVKNVANRLARETLREALAFFMAVTDSDKSH